MAVRGVMQLNVVRIGVSDRQSSKPKNKDISGRI